MRGVLTLLRWDVVMQFRYGFWLSGLAITLTWVLLLRALSPAYLEIWLPCVLYFDIGILGLMFIAGVLFFEKRQGVLDALVVTPLRTEAWLASKVLSLTLLATTVAAAMVLATVGLRADWLRVVPFFALVAALFTLGGKWLDDQFSTKPLFVLVGVLLGLVGGTIHLLHSLAPGVLSFGKKPPGGAAGSSGSAADRPPDHSLDDTPLDDTGPSESGSPGPDDQSDTH